MIGIKQEGGVTMRMGRIPRACTTAVLLASFLGFGGVESSDAKPDSRFYSLKNGKAKISGVRASEWTIQWWQWALSLPTSVNPLFDESGTQVELGQRGPVWFLGGVFNESGTAVRTATIPADKALFFPLLNWQWDNVGQDPPYDVEELWSLVRAQIDGVDTGSLFLTIDGIPVPGLEAGRVAAGPFAYAMPEGNVGQAFGLPAPRGIYAPSVSDGYWVMLRPLSLGGHTIHFGGTVGTFTLDITYNLTVVESNQP